MGRIICCILFGLVIILEIIQIYAYTSGQWVPRVESIVLKGINIILLAFFCIVKA